VETTQNDLWWGVTVSFIIIKLPLSASLSYPLEIPFLYLAVPFLASSSYCPRSQQSMYFLYVCKQNTRKSSKQHLINKHFRFWKIKFSDLELKVGFYILLLIDNLYLHLSLYCQRPTSFNASLANFTKNRGDYVIEI
jgi:hypothetical protein